MSSPGQIIVGIRKCAAAPDVSLRRWRESADRIHSVAATVVLGSAALVVLAWPGTNHALASWGGAALLLGGALIGVPHGSSDFVVAHRALRPDLGRAWLPAFLVGYLALVALTMLCWAAVPLATLLGFIALSGLHFGSGDLPAFARTRGLGLVVRATTPLLPVLVLHPAGVADLIAVLGGVGEATATRTLDVLRWPLLLPWVSVLLRFVVPRILSPASGRVGACERRGALEIVAIAFAALALPPLLAFAFYFCLVHAVRHMIDIADDYQPHDFRRATVLAAAIVLPSAVACLVALALAWDGMAGSFGTTEVIAWSIRLIAALTVPHMALEAWVRRAGRRGCG